MLESMTFPGTRPTVILAAAWLALAVAPTRGAADQAYSLAVQSVMVDGRTIPLADQGPLNLGPFPRNLVFGFGPADGAGKPPLRLRYQLEGYEKGWHEAVREMDLTVRFYNHAGDQFTQTIYPVSGESIGWTGSLTNSTLTHRRETLLVPPQAERLIIVVTSAGPPDSVGIYVVANLVAAKTDGTVLLRSPFDNESAGMAEEDPPAGWVHDGLNRSIARVIRFGQEPQTRAFAVLDEDPTGHGEWHNVIETAPLVTPGDKLVIEWNEMFSIGSGYSREAHYDALPPGKYRFRVAGVDAFGRLTGLESTVNLTVPQPLWKTPWFFAIVVLLASALMVGVSRYFVWQRMRREMLRLKQQRALEQERLRIARDIHDDLGARVTQISLLSAMSRNNDSLDKARLDFDRISGMARELVTALYETVWAVSPENDNLEALGSYLCQMANKLCEQTPLRCRFHVNGLPNEVQLSSQTRHNITMAVKEAVHNAVKHAEASEISISIAFTNGELEVTIQDNGRGFKPATPAEGNGMSNMRQRLASIGGQCSVESQPGTGTTVRIHLLVPSLEKIS
ncbi:MAG: sensor histidine kinase [Verrucomicrobiota bacterium]|jgi:signal transduction histidine kinase